MKRPRKPQSKHRTRGDRRSISDSEPAPVSTRREAPGQQAYFVLGILHGIFSGKLQLNQLEQFLGIWYPVEHGAEVCQSLVVVYARQGGKCISFTRWIILALEEGGDQVCCVGDQGGRVLVDGRHGEHCGLSHICVPVFEARPGGGQERLDELGFSELAEEAQCVSSDVLIGVLQVISDAIAARNQSPGASSGPVSTYQTSIISCFSFPPASSLGHIS